MSLMLTGNFFSTRSVYHDELGTVDAVLALNPAHPIFNGHFPGRPIVPGACLLQMAKELMQSILVQNIVLVKAHHLKFIAPIDPVRNTVINLHLRYTAGENNTCHMVAVYAYDNITCCKIDAVFRAI